MSANNKITEDKMKEQRKVNQRKEQYDNIVGLGWKGFGVFFVIVIAIVLFAGFFF